MSCDFRIIDHNYIFQDNVTLTASTANANFPVSNLKKYFRSKVWRTTATSGNVVIDLHTAEEIDSFAMVWDPVLPNRFTTGATFQLQASATNVWSSPPVNVTLSFDEANESITHFFATAEEYRYWRVVFTDTGNPDGFLEIPKLFLGKKLSFSRVPQGGFSFGLTDLSVKETSLFGHEYADIYPIKKRIEFDFNYLENSQCEELWKSFYRTGSVNPILVSIDSTEELLDKDRFTFYGKYQAELAGTHVIRDLFNFPLVIEEAF